jgi:hypothetical protein
VLNPEVVKGAWSEQEDVALEALIKQYGSRNWKDISSRMPGRIGKQCRERWVNHLNPEVSKQDWCESEDRTVVEMQRKIGNHWAHISRLLPGR